MSDTRIPHGEPGAVSLAQATLRRRTPTRPILEGRSSDHKSSDIASVEILRRAALERLRALQTPAVEALAQAIQAEERQLSRKGEVVGIGPDHAVRLRAATSVLDRTGMGSTSSTDVNIQASVHLMELIAQLDADR
jgi:hypothetical protein